MVPNFKSAWEAIGSDFEKVDEYGLGVRENLNDAVQAVMGILGLQPCEVITLLFVKCITFLRL